MYIIYNTNTLYTVQIHCIVLLLHIYVYVCNSVGSSKDPEYLYKKLSDLIERLPQHNRSTLETILTHLIKYV